MAARTTSTLVGNVIELDSSIDVAEFINTANLFYDAIIGAATHSAALAEMIERWLAAHFYSIRDPRVQSEGVKGLTQTYAMSVAVGLEVTTHGQQAIALDSSGKLAAWILAIKGKTSLLGKVGAGSIGISWMGTPEEDL